MYEHIKIWRYEDAPEKLQISQNGGDEDWLAEVPPNYANQYISWLESGTNFGVCDVAVYDHPEKQGWKIHIGCHS